MTNYERMKKGLIYDPGDAEIMGVYANSNLILVGRTATFGGMYCYMHFLYICPFVMCSN